MIDLLESVKENYNINIKNIQKLGETTINDIFLIENNVKKYIIKIYNVDEEKQVRNSLMTQKEVAEELKIAPNVLKNKTNKLYTEYNSKFYAIHDYIEQQNNNEIDKVGEISKKLVILHKKLKELDESIYKNKKEYMNYFSIKENLEQLNKFLKEVDIEELVRNKFERLLNKRKKLLEKYNCEYIPKECQVIHRDIRPRNIIINNNEVCFIDFDYVAYGDLLFEIGSAAMLISDFEIEKAKKFIEIYNFYTEKEYNNRDIFKNLLEYYVQSDFPFKLINKVENETLIGFIENRIKCLDFCERIICE